MMSSNQEKGNHDYYSGRRYFTREGISDLHRKYSIQEYEANNTLIYGISMLPGRFERDLLKNMKRDFKGTIEIFLSFNPSERYHSHLVLDLPEDDARKLQEEGKTLELRCEQNRVIPTRIEL